jgi:predicted negative regulator of RcsB-dependent stress response
MAAQSIASRSRTPRNVSDSDDVFAARAVEFTAWARRNARLIIAAAVVALALILGVVWYRMQQAQTREAAAAEFMRIEQTANSGNAALAIRDLEQFTRRYNGTPYADEARILLGQVHLQAGAPQQAVAALQGVANRVGKSPVGAQAALLLATAQAEAGNPAEAVTTYLRVADNARLEYHRQEALMSAATLREQTGDLAGAAELYRRLRDTAEEGSMQRSFYEMRLAEAEARAQAR